jgi:hypothetical protein
MNVFKKIEKMNKRQLLKICSIMNIKITKKITKLEIIKKLTNPLLHRYSFPSLSKLAYQSLFKNCNDFIKKIKNIMEKPWLEEVFIQHTFSKMKEKYPNYLNLEDILKEMFNSISTGKYNVEDGMKNLYNRDEYFDMKIILIMTLTKMQIECSEDEYGKPMYQISIYSDTPEYAKPTYPSDTKNKDTIQLIINKYTGMVFGTWEIPEEEIIGGYAGVYVIESEEGTCCNKCEVQGTLGTINWCVGTNCGKPKCRNCGSKDKKLKHFSLRKSREKNLHMDCSKPIDLPDWSTFTEEKFQEYLKKHGILNAMYLPIFYFLHDCKEFNELIKNYQKSR